MKLKNKRIAVTGGAGFIGSHLVDALLKEEPEKIIAVDNLFLGKKENIPESEKVELIENDASDYKSMRSILEGNQIEVVFDLAVIPLPTSLEKPRFCFDTNVNIPLALCELQREDIFKTLIHFSSSEAYGTALSAPMNEKHELNPRTPYAASKAAADHLILSYCHTFGIDAAILRPFNNFGPRQNEGSYAGLIPLTIKRILNNSPVIINGSGKQTRDFLYVSETADAAIKTYSSLSSRGKIINIGSGEEISVNEVVDMIGDIMHFHGKIIHTDERPGDVMRHLADISLAKKTIGFSPRTDFLEGLKKTIESYRK